MKDETSGEQEEESGPLSGFETASGLVHDWKPKTFVTPTSGAVGYRP
jgi:hypothetical protein